MWEVGTCQVSVEVSVSVAQNAVQCIQHVYRRVWPEVEPALRK
jgi:hypothetical protein